MRLLLTLAIIFFLLGGTYAYTQFAAKVVPHSQPYAPLFSDEQFSLEISRTFTAIPATGETDSSSNPFPDFHPAAIRVLFKGEPILIREDRVESSEPIKLNEIPAVENGSNEIFVFARLKPVGESELVAMQVQIRSGNRTVVRSTFTNQPGSSLIYGSVVFESTQTSDEHH